MLNEIREQYQYNRWANDRIASACAGLSSDDLHRDMRSSFPTVLGTLTHIAQAEWIWLERWNGHSPGAPPAWSVADVPALQRHWTEVADAQRAFLSGLTSGDLQRSISYSNLKGEPFEGPLWQLLRHVVNHSTYHRGQVVTMLRQLGAAAPSTDLVLYFRLQAAGALMNPAPPVTA